jgi:dipeptidyl aminopeptidase/acylaminoacyl peptidase
MRILALVLLAACASAPRPAERPRPPEVAAILGAFMNTAGVFSPDGRWLLFRSDRGGYPELFLAEARDPSSPATRLVAGPDRVGSASFTPDGRWILYRQDRGADEKFRLFRVRPDGSGREELSSPEGLWRDPPHLRGDQLVYSARLTESLETRLYSQPFAPTASPREIFRDDAPGVLLDVLADGRHGLYLREARRGGHDLLEVDLRDGTTRLLVPRDDRRTVIGAAAYSADGARVLVAGEELQAVDRVDLTVAATYPHRVGAIVASPRGDLLAVSLDLGNRSLVRLLDAHTLVPRRDVATPTGATYLGVGTEVQFVLAVPGTFTADGAELVIGVSEPHAPDDLFRVTTATGEVSPLRADPRPGLARLPAIDATIVDVPAFDGQPIPVNVYLPEDRPARLPTIVLFHGGPDQSSAFEWSPMTRVFTAHGYAVLEPNIRGSAGFGQAWETGDDREKRADAMRDVASVNAWARRQPWCDPDRLVVAGGSYGGYLVLMALTRQPELWAAGIDLAGPSDLTTFVTADTSARRYLTEFGDPETPEGRALLAAFSPLRDADKIVDPLFVYQGANDDRVEKSQADAIVASLRRRGHPVEYMVAADEGHTLSRRPNQLEFYARVLGFLAAALPGHGKPSANAHHGHRHR